MAAAAGCAGTPDGAVLQALGNGSPQGAEQNGFRVRDIVVDPLLHRAFVHVEQCGHPERPLLLLPFAAETEARASVSSQAVPMASPTQGTEKTTVPSGSVVAVAMGDAHMRLTVTGRLLGSAALGSVVDVQIAALNGPGETAEPLKRVRGRLTAADRVEVEP